jgi:hypothetical protein
MAESPAARRLMSPMRMLHFTIAKVQDGYFIDDGIF